MVKNFMKNIQETQQTPMREIQKIPSIDLPQSNYWKMKRGNLKISKREATPYVEMILNKTKGLLIWNYTGAGQNTVEWHIQSA